MAALIRRGFAASTFVLTLALATGVASANDEPHWVTAYAFAPSAEMGPVGPASAPNPNDPRGPLGPEAVQDVRLTHIVTVAASGRRVRLKLSNTHGAEPVRIGGLSIEHNGARHPARFDGAPSVVIPAGASWLSDPLDLTVEALDALAVSIDLPERTRLPTHRWRQTLTNADGSTGQPMRLGVLLSAVEVESAFRPGVIVAFGDSITEGTGALPGGAGGWPERLARRMVEAKRPWTVVNLGIGGNRLLHQGSGPSGLERLDADALAQSGARCLILLEGVNDIGRPSRAAYAHQRVEAAQLIAAYRQVIQRTRAAGLKAVLATIPPFEGASYFTAEGETTRAAVNQWLRQQSEADGLIDFDAVLRDPQAPSRMRQAFHSGDWLHPSDAGYQAMAEAIPLDVCG